jgi:hypothetical protein
LGEKKKKRKKGKKEKWPWGFYNITFHFY